MADAALFCRDRGMAMGRLRVCSDAEELKPPPVSISASVREVVRRVNRERKPWTVTKLEREQEQREQEQREQGKQRRAKKRRAKETVFIAFPRRVHMMVSMNKKTNDDLIYKTWWQAESTY